ncbi:hypothetical protein NPS29_25790, partial [Pseudomonas putida]|uniref:hypothetical protein n=1 Tax=Pseudomonas putida TaxID=303 RepID=UPI0023638A8F
VLQQVALDHCAVEHLVHRVVLGRQAAIRRAATRAREGRMMSMSDSWFRVFWPGRQKEKTRL